MGHGGAARSEAWLRAIVTAMAEGLLILDHEGRYVFANSSAVALLGVPLDQLLGAPYTLPLWQPSRRRSAAADHPFRQVHATGRPVLNQELRVIAPTAPARVIALNAVPLLDADGRISDVILTFSDISERTALEVELRHHAFHDPLTGLPNRAYFTERLAQALRRAARRQERVAVLFLDLDGFKAVNDRRGHGTGDALLVELGRRLTATLRQGDTVARFGGDEFAVLLEAVTTPAAALAVAAALRDALGRPLALPDGTVAVQASIGVALSTPARCTPAGLLQAADHALYQAKAAGKGRATLFVPAP